MSRCALDALRSGSWLTRRGLAALSAILLVGEAWVLSVAVRQDAIAHDFAVFYAASLETRAGDLGVLFDPALLREVIESTLGTTIHGQYPAAYPPTALLLFHPLSRLPFFWAYAIAMILGCAAYVGSILGIVRSRTVALAALAFPAVFVSVGHGQNGLLTAALLGTSLALLPRSPRLAGFFLGLLTFKPHLGILVPIALLAGRHWRTVATATVTAVAYGALATACFGLRGWTGFAETMPLMRQIMESGSVPFSSFQSAFSAARLAGAGLTFAYALQAWVTFTAAAAVAWAWSRPIAHELKAAILGFGTLLATPFLYDYDLVLFAVPVAFVVRHATAHGWLYWERTVICACALLPLFARSLGRDTGVAIWPPVVLVVFLLTIRRAQLSGTPRVAQAATSAGANVTGR